MRCIKPIYLVKPNEDMYKTLQVPCGACSACQTNRRNEWFIRLNEELKVTGLGIFLTLTYEDSKTDGNVNKRDIQLFIKRLRKKIKRKIKYYCVSEYGTNTYRPHYHLIVFNSTVKDYEDILESWGLGNIYVGTVTEASIMYVSKYHTNKYNFPDGLEPPFALMSTKPAIGYNYIKNNTLTHNKNIDRCYYQNEGKKLALPRYYKKKLYTDNERKAIKEKVFKIDSKAEILKDKKYYEDLYYRQMNYEKIYRIKSIKNEKL